MCSCWPSSPLLLYTPFAIGDYYVIVLCLIYALIYDMVQEALLVYG